MNIAVHMYIEERQHFCPAMLEFKNIPPEIQLFAQTEAHRHVERSITIKQLRRVTVQRALKWLASLFSRRAKQKPKNASALRRLYRGQPPNSFTFNNWV